MRFEPFGILRDPNRCFPYLILSEFSTGKTTTRRIEIIGNISRQSLKRKITSWLAKLTNLDFRPQTVSIMPPTHHRPLEQAIEHGVDAVGDGGEVLGAVFEVHIIGIDDEQLSFVGADPFLIEFV